MGYARRLGLVGAVGFAAVAALVTPALAVEYRLQVVSLFDTAFVSFLTPPELRDGASGPGLDRLGASLDQGRMPKGAVLFDRRVQPLGEGLAESWGGVRVIPVLKPAGTVTTLADEVAWEGKPGERELTLDALALYDALVRLSQPWWMRLPMIDGHGNFGSPDPNDRQIDGLANR